jgi:signal transduction histidine kinase
MRVGSAIATSTCGREPASTLDVAGLRAEDGRVCGLEKQRPYQRPLALADHRDRVQDIDVATDCRLFGCRSSGTCREPRQSQDDRSATSLDQSLVPALQSALAMHPAVLRSEIIDRRWLRWQRMIIVPVALTNVVLASLAGLPRIRVVALAAITAVFVGLILMDVRHQGGCPSSCPRSWLPRASLIASVVGGWLLTALTGGLSSPFLVFLASPVLITWAAGRPGREAVAAIATMVVSVATLGLLPDPWIDAGLTPRAHAVLLGWSVLLFAVVVGTQVKMLVAGLASMLAALDSVRNGVLDDVGGRPRALETMGAKLAHELKNPLAAIKSLIQLEADAAQAGEPRSQRRHEVMVSEVARMESILRDYLSFSRPLDEVDDLERAEVDVAALAGEVVAVFEGRADAAGVRLSHRGGARVRADARRLREALLNLTSNALEATPRGGSVEIVVAIVDGLVEVAVRDTGTGLSPQVAERIGTPFFTTRDSGTGLGVVIARSAIVQHGGTLRFTGRSGGGTTATISLPPWPGHGSRTDGPRPAR